MEVQEKSFAHVVAGLGQEQDFSATLAQEDFTKNPKPLPTSPALWAGRKNPPVDG